jgi:predicted nucleotidyltransferase
MKVTPDEKALYFSQKLHERIGPDLRQLILFGSRARGDAREGSDYDFTVVLTKKSPWLRAEIRRTELDFLNRFDELSSCFVLDEEGWELRKGFPIGMNILREGIPI